MFPMINVDFKHVWCITHDFITTPGNRDDDGTAGPSATTKNLLEAIEQDKTPAGHGRHTVRLYDDDGEIYYRGRMHSERWLHLYQMGQQSHLAHRIDRPIQQSCPRSRQWVGACQHQREAEQ